MRLLSLPGAILICCLTGVCLKTRIPPAFLAAWYQSYFLTNVRFISYDPR